MTDDPLSREAEPLIRAGEQELERRQAERRRENPKVACPLCGCRHSRVLESRDLAGYSKDYQRRRVCLNRQCGAIYLTAETALRVELPTQKSA